jgi:hypothetical protein
MERKRRSWRIAAAILLVLILLLTACTAGDTTDSGGEEPRPNEPAEQQEPEEQTEEQPLPSGEDPGPEEETAAVPELVWISEYVAGTIAELEAEFPVTVLYGDAALFYQYSFTAEPIVDEGYITGALDVLAEFLRDFPDGFLQEMYAGDGTDHPNHLTFLFSGKLRPESAASTSNPAAYAYRIGIDQYIALNITHDTQLRITLAHETMHAIDSYLDTLTGWDTYPEWQNYLPEGFEYNNSYVGADGGDYFDTTYTLVSGTPVWFVDVYSKTFDLEDRAVMFQSMFAGTPDAFWVTNKHITNRMKYMAAVIREHFRCLDGAGPAIWERLLP